MSTIPNRLKNQSNGKDILHTSTNDQNPGSKQKAVWDRTTTKMFIDALLDQVTKGERHERTLSKKGWRDAIAQFNATSGRNYDKQQIKNKWDSLKKDWVAWCNLFQHETGLGWDNEKSTVIASAEWWDAKELINPRYAKYRHEGLPNARELTYLFQDKTATGEFPWALSSGVLLDGHGEDGMDKNEGSGDSNDPKIGVDLGGSVGDGGSIGVGNLNINTSEVIGTSRSGDKRKRGGQRVRKGKIDSATIIGQRLKKKTGVIMAHTSAIDAISCDPFSIGIAIANLQKMERVKEDPEFFARCCSLMMKKEAREVFAAITDENSKIIWLKHEAYQH